MMEFVSIVVPRQPDYAPDDGFDVYGDQGTGSVDYDSPLNDEVILLRPDSMRRLGHLLEGHLMLGHLAAARGDGHLEDRFLSGRHLRPAADLVFQAGPYCLGRFQHAVVMRDALGNGDPQSATVLSNTINSAPRRACGLRLEAFDPQADRVTLSFTGSPDVG